LAAIFTHLSDALILIPTYNERENILRILQAVMDLEQGFHVLVIDDNSPDNTAELVEQFAVNYPNKIFIEKRKGKLGLGTAYIHGFRWGLKRGYNFIFEMDADFSHAPQDLIRLYDVCKSDVADVAIGSRYVFGGNVKNWNLERVILSYGASWYVRLITWMPVKDSTAGFICYKKEVLEKIDFGEIDFSGYAFQIAMKYKAWQLGFRLKEIPITFIDREFGESKMSINIFKEALKGVFKMRFG